MLKKHSRGFTLIELMVATGLFASIMTIAAGAYLIMISANREAQSISKGINSVSYALELMTRNIRTGTQYPTGLSSCKDLAGADSISFTDVNGRSVTYKRRLVGSQYQIVQTIGGVDTPLTDQSTDINYMRFYCTGTVPGDAQQASVIMVVSGKVLTAKTSKNTEFRVQTTATMRALDL